MSEAVCRLGLKSLPPVEEACSCPVVLQQRLQLLDDPISHASGSHQKHPVFHDTASTRPQALATHHTLEVGYRTLDSCSIEEIYGRLVGVVGYFVEGDPWKPLHHRASILQVDSNIRLQYWVKKVLYTGEALHDLGEFPCVFSAISFLFLFCV